MITRDLHKTQLEVWEEQKDGRLTYLIPLYGGIGNIIQTIPLILYISRHGHKVVGVRSGIDFCESEKLLYTIVDDIINEYECIVYPHDVPCRRLRYDARKMAEWQGWFKTYDFPIPSAEEVEITTNFSQMNARNDVIICPTCKSNWPMKQYNQWNELIDALLDRGYVVSVVGQKKDLGKIVHKPNMFIYDNLSLLQVAGLFRNAQFTICNEGGLAHLSAANGAKTFILMGGSHPIKNKPPHNAYLISAELPCQPCQLNGAYIDNDVNPPVFYGCKPEVIKRYGCVKCLDILKPEYILSQIEQKITLRTSRFINEQT